MKDLLAYQGMGGVPDLLPRHRVAAPASPAVTRGALDLVTLLELAADAADEGIDEATFVARIRREFATT